MALPGLESFDVAMQWVLDKWSVPGASLVVAKDDRLLLAHGYGFANKEGNELVQPTSLFRLGSLTKTITAVAILQLVEQGKLTLDDKVLPLLGEIGPRPEAISDSRVTDITVRNLLQHSGGWDRDVSGDAVFMPYALQATMRQKGPLPPDCPTVMRDYLERTLDFSPGQRYAYSNLGYCILGRIIERVTGKEFTTVARKSVLEPAGASRLQWGRTLTRATGEVTYYDYPGAPLPQAMPGVAVGPVPRPYGAYSLEAMDSYGSIIGAPIDYLRFMLAIDGRGAAALLNAASVKEMNRRPSFARGPVFYGLGVDVRQVAAGLNIWHSGSQDGVEALALRNADGTSWVVAFNTRPKDSGAFVHDFDTVLHTAAANVRRWPSGNLFDQFR